MRVAILGAGGVGSYYGGTLARAGHDVVVLARGPNLEALRSRGLEVRSPDGTFTVRVEVTPDATALGRPDLAIVAVKTYSLADVTPAVRRAAEAGAAVVPLLNGVEAADRLVDGGVPGSAVLGGLTQISAVRTAPGVVERRSSFQRVVVGELARGRSERAAAIAAAFRSAGVDAEASLDVRADLWRKLGFIAAMAAACGLARSPIGPVLAAPLGRRLVERAVAEVFAVARGLGIRLADDEEARVLAFIETLPGGLKPSFLLDLEAGGPTELDDLCGAVSRAGRRVGVETPVHDTAAAALGVAARAGAGPGPGA
ncbi:MAG TPA: ketopantoate reductase family protein [Thermoanaerobaculaceae bacterium]|nr:ketopantoate reductase family protein [Thermoanaerobaculaceae bacterium]